MVHRTCIRWCLRTVAHAVLNKRCGQQLGPEVGFRDFWAVTSTISRLRCCSCREWYRPHASALGQQKVCSEACRKARRAKLARNRRERDPVRFRKEERVRQADRRARVARDKSVSEASQGRSLEARHAPASSANALNVLAELLKVVDKARSVSRAGLAMELASIRREMSKRLGQGPPVSRASLSSTSP